MSSSTRIKGKALALVFGGVDYWADISSVVMDNEEADSGVVTFADAAGGGARQFFFNLTAIQSTASGSFWRMAWANTGAVVPFKFAPHGNAVATADEPHYTGTLEIGPKPALGGEAGAEYSFTTRWDIEGEPVQDVGASAAPAITAVGPAGRGEGDAVVISGTRFDGATAVEFDSVASPSIVVVNDTTISAVIPVVSGEVDVEVTSPAGTSAAATYTVV